MPCEGPGKLTFHSLNHFTGTFHFLGVPCEGPGKLTFHSLNHFTGTFHFLIVSFSNYTSKRTSSTATWTLQREGKKSSQNGDVRCLAWYVTSGTNMICKNVFNSTYWHLYCFLGRNCYRPCLKWNMQRAACAAFRPSCKQHALWISLTTASGRGASFSRLTSNLDISLLDLSSGRFHWKSPCIYCSLSGLYRDLIFRSSNHHDRIMNLVGGLRRGAGIVGPFHLPSNAMQAPSPPSPPSSLSSEVI